MVDAPNPAPRASRDRRETSYVMFFLSTVFYRNSVMPPIRSEPPDCLIVRAAQAAPAFEDWQAESVLEAALQSALGKRAARTCQGHNAAKNIIFRHASSRSRPDFRRDIRA